MEDKQIYDRFDSGKDMKIFNFMHNLDWYSDEDAIDASSEKSKDLAKFIYDNYHKMDDNEMKVIALKCIDIRDIKRILLNYELIHLEQKIQKMTLNEFTVKAMNLLSRYQGKAGGFLLEDNQWTLHRMSSTYYDVKENEILFENTMNKCDMEDQQTNEYLLNILKRLENISENMNIELRFKNRNKISHILIWVTDKTAPSVTL